MVKYTLLSNNDKTITQISELDRKMLRLLKNLYKRDDHFYKYESQMLTQGLFETLGDEEEQEEEEQERKKNKKKKNKKRKNKKKNKKRKNEEEEEEGRGAEELPEPPNKT